MVNTVGYAYPWDFDGDPAAGPRARDLGVNAVALAAAYHSTRVPTPVHPTSRLVTAPHAASYLPVRAAKWTGGLRPLDAEWLPEGAWAAAAKDVRAAGMKVLAWTVFTHTSVLGRANEDLVVRNAFGEPYTYALCPSAEAVSDYCVTLASEVVETAEPDGIILEACGRLGVDHGGHHDKVDFAYWTAVQKQLLSLCFCTACHQLYAAAGIDGVRLAALVRAAVGAEAPATVADALSPDLADAVTKVVAETATTLRQRVVAAARATRPDLRVTFHGAVDPLATGAFTALGTPPSELDSVVTSCWVGGVRAVDQLQQMSAYIGRDVAVGGYFRPDTLRSPEGPSLDDLAERYLAAGLSELHLYHLGLVPHPALAVLREFVGTVLAKAAIAHPRPDSQIGGPQS
ncbi:MAG TPA: hypothetical protein VM677_24125 [Actinokineospora sp.]|jgi:hypothetical protein|nr:hypothetical protein [Actinokineospora sp.]